MTLGTDATGVAYADERVLADLHATANAPLFSAHDVYLGSGIVGGRLMPIDEITRRMTDSAYRILNGESPGAIKVPPQVPGQPKFDWRELQRWDIPESRLPPGSLVQFRAPTLWSEHQGTVLIAAGALAIQALLIIGLLYERRARRRAEFESRRNLALAADISRRETMSAMTSTIAHELGQPLSAMLHNAEALQMMVNTNNATPETIEEILSDIHTDGIRAAEIIERHRAMLRSRQLQKKPYDLQTIVNDAVALVAYDMRARQIEVTVKLPSKPCVISGDPVLLQQVLVNLLINAMDAMAETPPGRRHIIDQQRSQARRCRSLRARQWVGYAAGSHRQAVHTIRHDETAWPRNWPRDRPNHCRGSRGQHQCPQQSRRGRDIHGHPAPREAHEILPAPPVVEGTVGGSPGA